MEFTFTPIGRMRVYAQNIPRHWSISDIEGELIINSDMIPGIRDIVPGQRLVVIFAFDRSRLFAEQDLIQKPPHKEEYLGVFSTCSPIRPNPVGMSVLKVLKVQGSKIRVRGVDMLDGTPILDIKPYIPAEV